MGDRPPGRAPDIRRADGLHAQPLASPHQYPDNAGSGEARDPLEFPRRMPRCAEVGYVYMHRPKFRLRRA